MKQRLSVALTQNLPQPLSYQAEHPDEIQPGQRILVPLGPKVSAAWVISRSSEYSGRLRSVLALFDDPFRFNSRYLRAIDAVSRTYLQSQGQLLEAALPADLKASKGWKSLQTSVSPGSLPFVRSNGADKYSLLHLPKETALSEAYNGPLEITGRDRLEQLSALAAQLLSAGKSLLTVAGDSETIEAMAEALPGLCAYHSRTPLKERRRIWQAAHNGEPQWIIGGVSAALLPMRRLGALLIIDADNPAHFSRFFRDYGAAHLLRLRSGHEGLPLIRSSCRPSVLTSWLSPQPELMPARDQDSPKTIAVKPARWDRPEALERLANSLIEDQDPKSRSLYVVAAPSAAQNGWCPSCRKRQNGEEQAKCPYCSGQIRLFPRPSVPWLRDLLTRRSGPDAVRILEKGAKPTSKDMQVVVAASQLPRAGEGYRRIVLVGPESWISLDEVDGALRMWALLEACQNRLDEEGEIRVHSAFHFHYALKLAGDAPAFFEREISYRRWFGLPPLCAVYQLDFRHRKLRTLGSLMRRWSDRFRDLEGTRIDQVRLQSRQPFRGFYRGSLVFHGQAEQIWESGMFPESGTSAKLIMA